MKALIVGLCVATAPVSLAQGDLMTHARDAFKPVPSRPPELKGNPSNPEKLELGKMLFFDPRLSSSWLISCNTCHNLGFGGVDGLEVAIGHGWQKGSRNSPTILNAVFNLSQLWDGRAKDLREQAKGPVQAAVEMNSDPERTIETLRSMTGYVEQFQRAFPGEDEAVTFENMAKAIEVFEATLLTPDSPFDHYLSGDDGALNNVEKEGLSLFMTRGCKSCHGGMNLGGSGYFAFGAVERPTAEVLPAADKGRFAITRTPKDEYVFRSPSLRNITLAAPYFHSGRVWSLKQAVRIMGSSQLGTTFDDREADAIVEFLKTLTGRQPTVSYPVLPPHTASTPRPNTTVPEPAQTVPN